MLWCFWIFCGITERLSFLKENFTIENFQSFYRAFPFCSESGRHYCEIKYCAMLMINSTERQLRTQKSSRECKKPWDLLSSFWRSSLVWTALQKLEGRWYSSSYMSMAEIAYAYIYWFLKIPWYRVWGRVATVRRCWWVQ